MTLPPGFTMILQKPGIFPEWIEVAEQAFVCIMAQKQGFKTVRRDVMPGTGHTFKMEEQP